MNKHSQRSNGSGSLLSGNGFCSRSRERWRYGDAGLGRVSQTETNHEIQIVKKNSTKNRNRLVNGDVHLSINTQRLEIPNTDLTGLFWTKLCEKLSLERSFGYAEEEV